MATTKKPTLKEMYLDLLTIPEIANDEKRKAFINGRIEALDKKASSAKNGNSKPTATQEANKGIKSAIKEYLDAHPTERYTVTDLIKQTPACAELSNQKVSALMRQMCADNMAIRVEEQGKAYFTAYTA